MVTNIRKSPGTMPKWALAYFGLTLAVLAFGFYEAMVAPKEATMGNLYRVFFYHLPHTILSFVFPYLNCGASFLYLYWRNRNVERAAAADAFALASAEITVLYCEHWPGNRHALGPRGLGHLVGVGCAHDDVPAAVAALRELPAGAAFLGYRPDGGHLGGARDLRRHRRADLFYVDPLVAHAASLGRIWWRRQLRHRSQHGACGSLEHAGLGDVGSLPDRHALCD